MTRLIEAKQGFAGMRRPVDVECRTMTKASKARGRYHLYYGWYKQDQALVQ